MTNEELMALIATKEIVGADLSGMTLDRVDFSGCRLERVSFKNSVLHHCRFRGAEIVWSDFRYAEIEHGTFEAARVDFCDFYRAFIDGVVIFNHSLFSNCSFNKTYLGDSAIIRKENLLDGRILQQDKEAYRKFLVDWHLYGTGERTNNIGAHSDWSPEAAVEARWADAEVIYKNFNALWSGKGYIADGNWAYVQGRRMERRRMFWELNDKGLSLWQRVVRVWHIVTNTASDLLFGYGESMAKMITTYVVIIFLFAWLFYSELSMVEYGKALVVSLKNMAALESAELQNVSPFVDMLNVVQTTIGVILTGIFGFILGNKIRNQ